LTFVISFPPLTQSRDPLLKAYFWYSASFPVSVVFDWGSRFHNWTFPCFALDFFERLPFSPLLLVPPQAFTPSGRVGFLSSLKTPCPTSPFGSVPLNSGAWTPPGHQRFLRTMFPPISLLIEFSQTPSDLFELRSRSNVRRD